MKKVITLFAMLMIVSVAMAENARIVKKIAADTTYVVADTVFYYVSDDGIYGEGTQVFTGSSNDDVYHIGLFIKIEDLQTGNYPDSVLDKVNCCLLNNSTYERISFARGLSDVIVTVDRGEVKPYINVNYTFVGSDSAIYNLSVTKHFPYEESYNEVVVAPTTDTIYDGEAYAFYFTDSLYKYEFWIGQQQFDLGADTFFINDIDTVEFRVYDINDADMEIALFRYYSGWVVLTEQADNSFAVVAQVLCEENKKFYINCKKPTGPTDVEDVAEETVRREAVKVTKYMINGQLFIERDGITYDAQGRVVRR